MRTPDDDTPADESLQPTLPSPPGPDAPVDPGSARVEPRHGMARYELGATIGRGGMGEVRFARDVVLGRGLAMKLVSSRSPGTVSRFVREARVQGQLEHPGIVPVHELGVQDDGRPYFTMKRVRGVTLEAVLRDLAHGDASARERWPRRRLLQALGAICLTIDFAHSHRVVHRDLKPANLMLGDFGEAYVLDWGIARHLGRSAADTDPDAGPEAGDATPPPGEGRTARGAIMGTPGYLAPEQASGEAVDVRADVYSLGAILFEVLTLTPLVEGRTVGELLERTRRGVDARTSARAPARQVPPELEAICLKATALAPDARYPSARALHDALDAFLSGERDVELRAALASRHLEAARQLAGGTRAGLATPHEPRRAAFRELGQALAMDPGNPEVLRTLVQLLGAPGDNVPPEAREELEDALSRRTKVSGRLAAFAYLSLFLYLPGLLWMGVRDVRLVVLLYGLVLASAGASWAVSRRTSPKPAAVFLPFVASTLLIASTSFVLGPFVFAPSFAATNAIAFAVVLERRHRAAALALGAAGVALPIAAQWLGLAPDPHLFSPAGLTIAPQMVALARGPTLALLAASTIGTVLVATLAVSRLRDALHEAEARLVSQSWSLRLLLPPAAGAATSGEHRLSAVPGTATTPR